MSPSPLGDGSVVFQSLPRELAVDAAEVVGLALVAGALSALVALVYRWYVRERAPNAFPMLVGLSGVAIYLNATRALSQVIVGESGALDVTTALFNIVVVVVSGVAARAAVDVGDRIAGDVFVATGGRETESEVSRMVQAVGRVITVELPDDVDDIVGYDPVPEETKAKLAGRTFVFPRRLTVDELRERLTTRLKADFAVGHVDVELAEDGEVDYLAVGSRAAGIGPTLPPETAAVAVRADPAFSASSGDLVQVWETDPAERVLTAELRGVSDDVVTLAIDAAEARKLDDTTEYKLVTLPVERRADREFASLLRAADETMAGVSVEAGSPLAGQPVGALDVAVVAVRPTDGPVEPLPSRSRTIGAGELLYVVATPEAIRRVESGATGRRGEPDLESGSKLPPEQRIGPGDAVAEAGAAASADADTSTGTGTQSSEGGPARERAQTRSTGASDRPGQQESTADATETTPPEATSPTSGSRPDDEPPEHDGDAGAETASEGETTDERAVAVEEGGSGEEGDEGTSDGEAVSDDEERDGDALELGDPGLADFEASVGEETGADENETGADENETLDENETGADEDETLDDLIGTDPEELTGADVEEIDPLGGFDAESAGEDTLGETESDGDSETADDDSEPDGDSETADDDSEPNRESERDDSETSDDSQSDGSTADEDRTSE